MKILFIDDDQDDTEIFKEAVDYLNASKFIEGDRKVECLTVNDGRTAIRLLSGLKEKPDYIFLDINMPVMGGKECLKLLKERPDTLEIPVVIFSTSFRTEEENEFRRLGAMDCIRKPAAFNELARLLSKYIYSDIR